MNFARWEHGSSDKDYAEPVLHNADMATTKNDREENHLKAWREFRRLTQEELGSLIGTTGSVISLLESGSRKLSPKWLRKLAPALNTSPGYLLDHDPDDLPTAILDVWAAIPEIDRPRALQVLQAFRRIGTTG
jgi:transcriptional regulator with XRE-family HTH domain